MRELFLLSVNHTVEGGCSAAHFADTRNIAFQIHCAGHCAAQTLELSGNHAEAVYRAFKAGQAGSFHCSVYGPVLFNDELFKVEL